MTREHTFYLQLNTRLLYIKLCFLYIHKIYFKKEIVILFLEYFSKHFFPWIYLFWISEVIQKTAILLFCGMYLNIFLEFYLNFGTYIKKNVIVIIQWKIYFNLFLEHSLLNMCCYWKMPMFSSYWGCILIFTCNIFSELETIFTVKWHCHPNIGSVHFYKFI